MYAHVQLGARDIRLMSSFYDKVLGELGLVRMTPLEQIGPAGVIWRRANSRWPQFVIGPPYDGRLPTLANGSQVSFLAPSRAAVDAAHAAALASCGVDLGQPALRPQYAPDFYAAYCRDPEGNKLCFVHTE